MLLPDNDEGRPPAKERPQNVVTTDIQSVPKTADILGDLDALAHALRGYFVVQVVIDDAGHRRTNVYRSCAAAERAVQRARERGRYAHVSLCQLLPVGVVAGLGSGVG